MMEGIQKSILCKEDKSILYSEYLHDINILMLTDKNNVIYKNIYILKIIYIYIYIY